ncbi:ATP-binding cassette domain-containing protein [Microbacterium sp.]|uniref:ABC transporter ATP-binding protein n=1 Tax=Microbacterium sp. TaxID=51671 RepID=UPI0026212D3A|nr:ATP-binding cassette domain-containing protein [Microbacterium sp.]
MTNALVDARGISARFLDGSGVGPLDVTIAPGERILVLGPSGCGKSTLLRLLQGAIPQAVRAETTGGVKVAGRDVQTQPLARQADVVGVVAQDPATGVCLPDVEDEVAFPLENLAVDPVVIPREVGLALAGVGAGALRGRDTSTLSGGETQRIALAAATVTRPLLLLLDEPTAMLDADGITAVRRVLDELGRADDVASVLVEHRLDEFGDARADIAPTGDAATDAAIAAGLPERWLVLDRGGRVLFDGRAADMSVQVARTLLAQGCWLPLERELFAVTGIPGGLDDDRVAAYVRELADAEPTAPVIDPMHRADSQPETLAARAVDVVPGGAPRRSAATPVLRGVTLELRTGEVVALVGANGGGKSSLLHCLAGVARAGAGEIEGPRAGLVFQNPEHQFSAHTVREEVAIGLPRDSRDRVEWMLQRFGLADLADRNPHTLSGGQKRRLSLAAMLIHERPFLLADEPGFGLDRHSAIVAMRALRDAARAGRGILFSSHDLRAVATYADRVLVIADGGIAADTTPGQLLRDDDLLERAGLHPPRLLRWLAPRTPGDDALRTVLARLDEHAFAGASEAVTR